MIWCAGALCHNLYTPLPRRTARKKAHLWHAERVTVREQLNITRPITRPVIFSIAPLGAWLQSRWALALIMDLVNKNKNL